MSEDIPLICDERGGIYLLSYSGSIRAEDVERISHAWARAMASSDPALFLLPDTMTIRQVVPPRRWPDAEHCAA